VEDPYLGQPKQVNIDGYMAGGRVFFGPIICRNLTPDYSGLPLGGASYEEYWASLMSLSKPNAINTNFA